MNNLIINKLRLLPARPRLTQVQVRAIYEKSGLSLRGLADFIGASSRTTISNYISGRRACNGAAAKLLMLLDYDKYRRPILFDIYIAGDNGAPAEFIGQSLGLDFTDACRHYYHACCADSFNAAALTFNGQKLFDNMNAAKAARGICV